MPGFEVPIRRDRNCSGGGIIFYYKSFVNVIRRQDLEHGDLLECMWFELKTKFQSILININYRSVRQAPAYYWQYFDFMLKRALDENCNIICLGDLNINFMANIPTNITGAWGMDFVSSSPLFSTTPLFSKFSYKSFLFQNFHNHSFFLHLTISVDVIHHE